MQITREIGRVQTTKEIGHELIVYIQYQYNLKDFFVGYSNTEGKRYLAIKDDHWFFDGESDLNKNEDFLALVLSVLQQGSIFVRVFIVNAEFHQRDRGEKFKRDRITNKGLFKLKQRHLDEILKLYSEITKPLELRTVDDVAQYLKQHGFLEY